VCSLAGLADCRAGPTDSRAGSTDCRAGSADRRAGLADRRAGHAISAGMLGYPSLFTLRKSYRFLSWSAGHKMSILKVPFGQIGSTWEWHHWIGLEKDINRYRFLIFVISLLNIWKDFKVLNRFMQKWIQTPTCSDHGLHRILSSYWLAHFSLMQKSTKGLLYFGLNCGMLEFFTHKL
jgi:hypothetical protein